MRNNFRKSKAFILKKRQSTYKKFCEDREAWAFKISSMGITHYCEVFLKGKNLADVYAVHALEKP